MLKQGTIKMLAHQALEKQCSTQAHILVLTNCGHELTTPFRSNAPPSSEAMLHPGTHTSAHELTNCGHELTTLFRSNAPPRHTYPGTHTHRHKYTHIDTQHLSVKYYIKVNIGGNIQYMVK